MKHFIESLKMKDFILCIVAWQGWAFSLASLAVVADDLLL